MNVTFHRLGYRLAVVVPIVLKLGCASQALPYGGTGGASGSGGSGPATKPATTFPTRSDTSRTNSRSVSSSTSTTHDAAVDAGGADATADAEADAASAAGDAGVDATTGDGFASTCSPTATWSAGVTVGLPGLADAAVPPGGVLGGITLDELTVAWVTGPDGSAIVQVADRANTVDPFGPPTTLPSSAAGAALDRVAISSNGLRIGVLWATRLGFAEFAREQRGDVFVEQDEGTFDTLNALGATFTGAMAFGDPVVGDAETLFYSVYGGVDADGGILPGTIHSAAPAAPGIEWLDTTTYSAPGLTAQAGGRRMPTGISADRLTLFFWDQVAGIERAAFRPTGFDDFEYVIDVGPLPGAAPNTACNALYFAAPPPTDVELLRAAQQ